MGYMTRMNNEQELFSTFTPRKSFGLNEFVMPDLGRTLVIITWTPDEEWHLFVAQLLGEHSIYIRIVLFISFVV